MKIQSVCLAAKTVDTRTLKKQLKVKLKQELLKEKLDSLKEKGATKTKLDAAKQRLKTFTKENSIPRKSAKDLQKELIKLEKADEKLKLKLKAKKPESTTTKGPRGPLKKETRAKGPAKKKQDNTLEKLAQGRKPVNGKLEKKKGPPRLFAKEPKIRVNEEQEKRKENVAFLKRWAKGKAISHFGGDSSFYKSGKYMTQIGPGGADAAKKEVQAMLDAGLVKGTTTYFTVL